MKEFIECGTLANGGSYSPIVCDPLTGDVIYVDDLMGTVLFSEITVSDPLNMREDTLTGIAKKLAPEYDGVICTEKYLIYLKDGVATYRPVTNSNKVEQTVSYSLDVEYDGEVELA